MRRCGICDTAFPFVSPQLSHTFRLIRALASFFTWHSYGYAAVSSTTQGRAHGARCMQVPWTHPPGHPERKPSLQATPSDPPGEGGGAQQAADAIGAGNTAADAAELPLPSQPNDTSVKPAAAEGAAGAGADGEAAAKVSTAEEVAQEVGFRARSLFMQLSDCGGLPRVPLQRTATPIVPVPAPGTRGGRWPKMVKTKSTPDKPPVVGHGVRSDLGILYGCCSCISGAGRRSPCRAGRLLVHSRYCMHVSCLFDYTWPASSV